MMWWFLILAFSGGAVLWAGIALYFRVRSYIKQMASKEVVGKE
jgi:hypothetical protein